MSGFQNVRPLLLSQSGFNAQHLGLSLSGFAAHQSTAYGAGGGHLGLLKFKPSLSEYTAAGKEVSRVQKLI